MAYEDERNKAGRQPIAFIEVDADYCPYTYGVNNGSDSFCNASEEGKCYNTRATCKDPDTYAADFDPNTWVKTYRFADASTGVPASMGVFPTLLDLDSAPTRITPSSGLGERSIIKAKLQDHPHHDIGIDKYYAERDYTPEDNGTFWGKWKARNPFYRTRAMRSVVGYLTADGVDWSNFRTKHYVIDNIKGPDSGGNVVITGKDPLTLLEGERAVVPEPSRGELSANIDDQATSFTLSPIGIGDEEYPASFRCRIGGEGFDVTRSGDTCSITNRGLYEDPTSHDSGDTVQVVKQYIGLQVHEIVYDLITSGRPELSQYIPYAEWTAEADEYLIRAYSSEITEPTAVNELIAELMESAPFYVFWDERNQKISLTAIKPPTDSSIILTDEAEILTGGIRVTDKPKDRVDEVWVYFAMINPTEGRKKAENYAARYIYINSDAQSQEQYGGRQIKKVYSRWIGPSNGVAAQELAQQYIKRFNKVPIQATVQVDARHSDPWTGDVVKLDTKYLQAPDGQNDVRPCEILEADEVVPGTKFEYLLQTYDYLTLINESVNNVEIRADLYNINLREQHDLSYTVVKQTVIVIIPEGITIGSTDPSLPAMTIGDWPAGTELFLINKGTIEGKGGKGGRSGGAKAIDWWPYDVPAEDGGDGGDAIHITYDVEIDNSQGSILAGGGGGGGGGSVRWKEELASYVYGLGVLGGGSGGGGSGSYGGNAGSNAVNVPDWSRDKFLAMVDSNSGSNGSSSTSGTGGAGKQYSGYGFGGTGGDGGSGGGPGQWGQSGSQGTWHDGGDVMTAAGSAGAGGAPGKAIVTHSGTATITATGTIAGDIT